MRSTLKNKVIVNYVVKLCCYKMVLGYLKSTVDAMNLICGGLHKIYGALNPAKV